MHRVCEDDVSSTIHQEIRHLIAAHGRITFAQFMQACLYSRRGGFYASRTQRISTHFGTSAMTHPVFGALIARQLEEMWHRLGDPPVFHVVEVGCGDGSLARSIVHACSRMHPEFAAAVCYVAADHEPRRPQSADRTADWDDGTGVWVSSAAPDAALGIQRVKADGLRAFRNVVGCILSNELLDNFPVHRFAIQGGCVKEVFVTLDGDNLVEVLDEPSSARIAERLAGLGLSLTEGYRGEVNLGLEDWTRQVSSALDRGFVLTIDYGEQAADLYCAKNKEGTLVCYQRHVVLGDPYVHVGEQDITCHVDFTSLMRLGDAHGLRSVGCIPQSEFLTKLGFYAFLDALEAQGLSVARTALSRMAMTALVDPEEYGAIKVLAQTKGVADDVQLRGLPSLRTC
jgi:SAM-dependent MidA family methyltransferase